MTLIQSLDYLLDIEGGFVNHPSDKGGPTKYGITKATLASWRKRPVTDKEVFELTALEAKNIYTERYWLLPGLQNLTAPKVAFLLFIQGVHRGPVSAAMVLQRVLNEHFIILAPKLKVDGVLGQNTIRMANSMPEWALCLKLIQGFQRAYVQIVERDPSQLVFLEGWLDRTFKLQDKIA
jgi:lysozyme family protein